ncbi:hypothetical protein ASG73_17175 [Janibacter sp. Soil728]|uniref:2-hydroxyacid dehydrogenase n=1 Tax=Janibacter sp. Soil728 TaxID=1736393 RepID=UPI0006FD9299|nr:2-hydroxyacid dehydrogenase [Janibacter sp. Soil728]KRE35072.1 hypothetical protein ASG73_17175 [Janibacter sp. Soil728]
MKDRVVVLSRAGERSIPGEHIERIRERADTVFVVRREAPTPAEAVELLRGATVLATTNVTLPLLDDALLARLPRLRSIVLYATGYEHVDVDLLERHGVLLQTLPTYATTAVAEHALALMLSLATRAHLANDKARGQAHPRTSLRGVELGGRTLGIIGVGRIGTHLARIGGGLGMRVLGSDTDRCAAAAAAERGMEMASTDEVIARADVVALCASTDRHEPMIIDAERVRALDEGAFLVNIGRPGLVDTHAVVDALRAGRLRGYAVDDIVLDPVAHSDLISEGRVLQTAHSAWWRDEVLERGADLFGLAVLESLDLAAKGRVA